MSKNRVDDGSGVKPHSVKAQGVLPSKSGGNKGDVCTKMIRKHIKGVVDVKRIRAGEYEVTIA